MINSTASELKNKLHILREANDIEEALQGPSDSILTYIHELYHCYHIFGSPLFTIYKYIERVQNDFVDDFIEIIKDSPEFHIEDFRKNKEIFFSSIDPKFSEKLMLSESLKSLYANDFDFDYAPQVKDYAYAIYFFSELILDETSDIFPYLKSDFYRFTDLLCHQLLVNSNHFVDIFPPIPETIEEYLNAQHQHSFNSMAKGTLGPVRAIIEGYARLSELISGYGLQNSSSFESTQKLGSVFNAKKKLNGEYGITFSILLNNFKWMMEERDMAQFALTSLAFSVG